MKIFLRYTFNSPVAPTSHCAAKTFLSQPIEDLVTNEKVIPCSMRTLFTYLADACNFRLSFDPWGDAFHQSSHFGRALFVPSVKLLMTLCEAQSCVLCRSHIIGRLSQTFACSRNASFPHDTTAIISSEPKFIR